MKYLIYVSLSLTLFVLACTKAATTTSSAAAITEADAQRASAKWPNTTVAELTEGKALYEQHCGNCHALKDPKSESEEEWYHEVPPMAKKAKIDAATEQKILKYVVTMCTK